MDTNMTQSKSEANQVVVLGRNQSDLALSRNLFGDEFSAVMFKVIAYFLWRA